MSVQFHRRPPKTMEWVGSPYTAELGLPEGLYEVVSTCVANFMGHDTIMAYIVRLGGRYVRLKWV